MHFLQQLKVTTVVFRAIQRQELNSIIPKKRNQNNVIYNIINRTFAKTNFIQQDHYNPIPLRNKKPKSSRTVGNYFVDIKQVFNL